MIHHTNVVWLSEDHGAYSQKPWIDPLLLFPRNYYVLNLDCDWSVGVEIVGCKEWGKHQHSQSWISWLNTQYLKLPHHQVEYVHNVLYSIT